MSGVRFISVHVISDALPDLIFRTDLLEDALSSPFGPAQTVIVKLLSAVFDVMPL
jgi:hypothetical protein